MSRKKKTAVTTLSPSMQSLVHEIGKTIQEVARLKRDLKEIDGLRKRKTGKNKKPPPFLEIMRRYGELERRVNKITRGIFKNGR